MTEFSATGQTVSEPTATHVEETKSETVIAAPVTTDATQAKEAVVVEPESSDSSDD